MAYLKHLLIVIFLVTMACAKAQSLSYQQADSISYALYQAGNWPALITYGQQAIAAGNDFPLLRLRLGYAQISLNQYSAALRNYNRVLQNDSYNTTARYYLYLCNLYINRTSMAYYHAGYLDTGILNQEKLTPYGLIQAGLETGLKSTNNSLRGTGTYIRASLSNRLGWKVQLDQSVVYYNQDINYQIQNNLPLQPFKSQTNSLVNNSVQQFEYYAKLSYTPLNHFTILGAYHYLNTDYAQNNHNNHLEVAGIRYAGNYFEAQADAGFSRMSDTSVSQYNLQLSFYPFGNLNFYTVTRGSVLQQAGNTKTIFSQLAGVKVYKSIWLEGLVTFGRLNNYTEADGLYVYNALDVTTFKTGSTAYYLLNKHALIYLNDTFERKTDYYTVAHYNQNSITGGFTWKF